MQHTTGQRTPAAVRFAAAFLSAFTTIRLLTGQEALPALPGVLAGLLIVALLSGPVSALAWIAGGGSVTGVTLGHGPPIRLWRRPSGRVLRISAVPLGLTVLGFGARPGRHPRGPFVTVVATWAAIGVGAIATMFLPRSGLLSGLAVGAFLHATLVLFTDRTGANLPAALSHQEARRRARLTDVALAAGRRGHHTVLTLTGTGAPVPARWTDSTLLAYRADALRRLHRPTDAVRLLRPAVAGSPFPLLRAELAVSVFHALLTGDVRPADTPAAVAEILGWTAAATGRTGHRHLQHLLTAQATYLHGDAQRALRAATTAARHAPPGNRADAYALAALATTHLGDHHRADAYLHRAVRDDADAPLIAPATALLAAPPAAAAA